MTYRGMVAAWVLTLARPNGAFAAEGESPKADEERATGSAGKTIEVSVRGQTSDEKRLRDSARAVKVVDTFYAGRQTRDLADVLGAIEGVSVRRTGGLGSSTSFSLNGLYDKQIRFFLDGLPLDIASSPFGISAIPVNLVDGIEIHRGVVPIRFGADALGGAVNLIPRRIDQTNVQASYQSGSFGTYRVSSSGRYLHRPSGFFASGSGIYDRSRNDYFIDVPIADRNGRLTQSTVRRFHDGYLSYGGSLCVGFVDKPWAKRLALQIVAFTYDKELQHDVLMARPIGAAKYGATTFGGTIRWNHDFSRKVSLELVASQTRQILRFQDTSKYVYDWFGKKIAERSVPGELDGPHDTTVWQNISLARAFGEWRLRQDQSLRLATTGRLTDRSGTEKAFEGMNGIDVLAGNRDLGTIVSGLEWEWNAFDMRPRNVRSEKPFRPADDSRLQNIFALKHYYYAAAAKNVKVGLGRQSLDTSGFRLGIADGVRIRVHRNVNLKASYELATRIPTIDEFFGDSVYLQPNLGLVPESSHNGNLSVLIDTRRTKIGNFTFEVDGFWREAQDLIVLLAAANGVQYDNVGAARIKGVEGSVQWISPGHWLILDGNATWQDARNVSTDGKFKNFDNERIPNRPWFFANWSGRLQWRKLFTTDDGIAPYYMGRYVHEFFRNWESVGDRDFKAMIPQQIVHTLGLTYWKGNTYHTSGTFEVDNIADARVYDFFGVQKPGRSFSIKVTGEL